MSTPTGAKPPQNQTQNQGTGQKPMPEPAQPSASASTPALDAHKPAPATAPPTHPADQPGPASASTADEKKPDNWDSFQTHEGPGAVSMPGTGGAPPAESASEIPGGQGVQPSTGAPAHDDKAASAHPAPDKKPPP